MQDHFLNGTFTVPIAYDEIQDKIIDDFLKKLKDNRDTKYVVNISVSSLVNHIVKWPYARFHLTHSIGKMNTYIQTDVKFSSQNDADSFIHDINSKSVDLQFIYNILDSIYELSGFDSFDINDFTINYISSRLDDGYFHIPVYKKLNQFNKNKDLYQ